MLYIYKEVQMDLLEVDKQGSSSKTLVPTFSQFLMQKTLTS